MRTGTWCVEVPVADSVCVLLLAKGPGIQCSVCGVCAQAGSRGHLEVATASEKIRRDDKRVNVSVTERPQIYRYSRRNFPLHQHQLQQLQHFRKFPVPGESAAAATGESRLQKHTKQINGKSTALTVILHAGFDFDSSRALGRNAVPRSRKEDEGTEI